MSRIEVKVITRARRESVEKVSERHYKIKVSSPPEKGRANDRVVDLISAYFRVPRRRIRILSGVYTNRKIIEVG